MFIVFEQFIDQLASNSHGFLRTHSFSGLWILPLPQTIVQSQKHLSNTLDLPSLKRLRVSAKEFPQQLTSNRKPFLTVPRYITFEMASFFELTPVWVAKSLALSYQIHAFPHDEAYDVFMTLPAHTSTREDAGQSVLSRAIRPPTDKPPSIGRCNVGERNFEWELWMFLSR